jgi:hypothetical protein
LLAVKRRRKRESNETEKGEKWRRQQEGVARNS